MVKVARAKSLEMRHGNDGKLEELMVKAGHLRRHKCLQVVIWF